MVDVGKLSVFVVARTETEAVAIATRYGGDMARLLSDAQQAGAEFIVTDETGLERMAKRL